VRGPQCRNQRGTRAGRDDAEQARAIGDGIEEAHDRADLLRHRRREQQRGQRNRETPAEHKADPNRMNRLRQHEPTDAALARAERHAHADLPRALLERPNRLLYEQAASDFGLHLQSSYVIGDSSLDVQAAARFAGTGCLVETGWPVTDEGRRYASFIGESIADAVDWILERESSLQAGP
jgi:HAD-hyrolase-like